MRPDGVAASCNCASGEPPEAARPTSCRMASAATVQSVVRVPVNLLIHTERTAESYEQSDLGAECFGKGLAGASPGPMGGSPEKTADEPQTNAASRRGRGISG